MRVNLPKIGALAKLAASIEYFHYLRGQIVGIWTTIEGHMDMANAAAWHISEQSVSKTVPQSLRWKIELFERIHREILPFKELREQASKLAAEVKRYQDDRHWLVHGNIVPSKSRADCWFFTRGKYTSDDGLDFVERTFTVAEIKELKRSLLTLSGAFAVYSIAIQAKLRQQPTKD